MTISEVHIPIRPIAALTMDCLNATNTPETIFISNYNMIMTNIHDIKYYCCLKNSKTNTSIYLIVNHMLSPMYINKPNKYF